MKIASMVQIDATNKIQRQVINSQLAKSDHPSHEQQIANGNMYCLIVDVIH